MGRRRGVVLQVYYIAIQRVSGEAGQKNRHNTNKDNQNEERRPNKQHPPPKQNQKKQKNRESANGSNFT